jgi:hypothetical protein
MALIFLITSGVVLLGFGAVLYILGQLVNDQRRTREQSQLTLLASLWATVEAKGLQRSTVIQRIIEKYSPVPAKGTDANVQTYNDAFEEALGFGTEELPPKQKAHQEFMSTFDFDAEREKDQNPEDLV